MTPAAEIGGQPEIHTDGLGMTDMEIAVRLGRKAGDHLAAVLAGLNVGFNNLADKMPGGGIVGCGHCVT